MEIPSSGERDNLMGEAKYDETNGQGRMIE